MADPVRELRSVGRDITEAFISKLPRELERCCFVCANSYRSFRQNIGATPISNAAAIAKCAKYFEYEVFFVHNPHANNFLEYLSHFVAITTSHLIVYYVGQGTTNEDLDTTRKSDEVLTFDDGSLYNDDMIDALEMKPAQSRITLITDTCRPGSIWNARDGQVGGRALPPRILTLSAVPLPTTSKQMMVLCQSQGIFTFNVTKSLKMNPKITVQQLVGKMQPVMAEFAQEFQAEASSPEMLDETVLEQVDD